MKPLLFDLKGTLLILRGTLVLYTVKPVSPHPQKDPVWYYDGNKEKVSCERMICEKKNLTMKIVKGRKKEVSVTLATSTGFACKKWIHLRSTQEPDRNRQESHIVHIEIIQNVP